MTAEAPLCIAHRGGPGPENSLAAIHQSLTLGVGAIEVDVWQIHGELWVTHDRRLGRDLPGKGLLAALSRPQLEGLRRPDGEPLLRLEQVLRAVADQTQLNIELKGPDCVPALCEVLEEWRRERSGLASILVSSFDHGQLAQLRERMPEVRRGALFYGLPLEPVAQARALGAYSLHLSIDFLPGTLVREAQREGLKVYVYTANDEDDWRRLQALGVDGIFTDRPEALLQLLGDGGAVS